MPLLCSTLCPDAHTAAVVAGERVHASAIAPDLGVGALILVDARSFPFRSPFFFLRARSSSSGQNRAGSPPFVAPATARCPASIHRAPTRYTSPRSSSISPRARPSPIRPKSRIRPPSTIEAPLRASPLSSTTTFRPSSAQNRSTVSPAATLAHSPTLSLSESALRRPRIAASPPRNAPSAARTQRQTSLRLPMRRCRAP